MLNQKSLMLGMGSLLLYSAFPLSAAFGQQAFINKGSGSFKSAALVCDQKNLVSTVELDEGYAPVYISWNKPGLTGGVVLHSAAPHSPSCGMGTCYYEWLTGDYRYTVARSNIVDDVRSLTNGRVTVTRAGQVVYNETCRAPERAVVQCITKDRSIYVIKNTNGTYSYKSFDYSSSNPAIPSLSLINGSGFIGGGSGLATYSFNNGAYNYQLLTEPYNPADQFGYARLLVRKGATVILDQLCDAYALGVGAL